MKETKLNELNLLDIGNTIQLTGAIYAGNGRVFLCLLPNESMEGPLEQLVMNNEDWKAFLRQSDLLEVQVHTKEADGSVGKAIIRKCQRQIDQNVSWRVYRRDNYTCRYCGRDNVPLTVDHLILWEDGGPSIEDNLVSACKKCNKIRGNTSYVDWLSHPYYKDVSTNLLPLWRNLNVELIATLDKIPLQKHKRSR